MEGLDSALTGRLSLSREAHCFFDKTNLPAFSRRLTRKFRRRTARCIAPRATPQAARWPPTDGQPKQNLAWHPERFEAHHLRRAWAEGRCSAEPQRPGSAACRWASDQLPHLPSTPTNRNDEARTLPKPRTARKRAHLGRCLTFDMRGDRPAQPVGHPLDGRVRCLFTHAFALSAAQTPSSISHKEPLHKRPEGRSRPD
jgi:hypothetical protein